MKIKIINPNTDYALTNDLKSLAEKHVRPSTEIIAVSPQMGPASIESFYDDYLAIPGILEEIKKGESEEGADAYVIACFGDPGLLAAREITDAPVIGIAEAAMYMASMLAATFTIVTTLPRTYLMSEHLLYHYGMQHKCKNIRTTPLHVLEVQHNSDASLERIIEECRKAREEDKAESVVLGCAAMSAKREYIEQQAGIPIIDGTVAAVKFCESFVDLGMKTSKLMTFAPPEEKEYSGILKSFGK